MFSVFQIGLTVGRGYANFAGNSSPDEEGTQMASPVFYFSRKSRLGFLIFFLGLTAAAGAKGRFFGDDLVEFKPSGYFRVEQSQGVFWFVTPDGYAFFSMGVNHLGPEGYYSPRLGYSPYQKNILALYKTEQAWSVQTRERLEQWGFNTIGAWGKRELFAEFPYVRQLNFSALGGGDWLKGSFPDVFDPQWEKLVQAEAQKLCAPLKDDPWLVGYFTDNELHFGPDWRNSQTLVHVFMALPASAAGKQELVRFFRANYGDDFSRFEKVWKSHVRNFDELYEAKELGAGWWLCRSRIAKDVDAFNGLVAERYFSVVSRAIKSQDPNHLLLGCRFHALGVSPSVVKSAGKWMDVVSINYYYMTPLQEILPPLFGGVDFRGWMKKYYELSGKPLLATEFSYRAVTSGLPNTKGAPVTVFSQADRGRAYAYYAGRCQAAPYIIGYHWFNYMDEPRSGRFDGENSNYGLVNERDRPYEKLTRKISRVNGQAVSKHLASAERN